MTPTDAFWVDWQHPPKWKRLFCCSYCRLTEPKIKNNIIKHKQIKCHSLQNQEVEVKLAHLFSSDYFNKFLHLFTANKQHQPSVTKQTEHNHSFYFIYLFYLFPEKSSSWCERWVQTAVSFFSAAFSLFAEDINPVRKEGFTVNTVRWIQDVHRLSHGAFLTFRTELCESAWTTGGDGHRQRRTAVITASLGGGQTELSFLMTLTKSPESL